MPVRKPQAFLDEQQIKYVVINHSPAYTAHQVAASSVVPRREFAKAVLVKLADHPTVMGVVSASDYLDLVKPTLGDFAIRE
ncbi:MAG: hypothetical protein WAL83_06680 [Arenicellales bacterium]